MDVKIINFPISITPFEANPMIKNKTVTLNWEIKLWESDGKHVGSISCKEKDIYKEYHELSSDEEVAIKELNSYCTDAIGIKIHSNNI